LHGLKFYIIDLILMSNENYVEQVYFLTKKIPVGKVTTYGSISKFLTLGSARMVGWALKKSFTAENVPAHRVVNRKGELSGRNHFATPTLMQELLEKEGVEVKDNTVVSLSTYFWDPNLELDDYFD